jgi:hypothetical protein
MGLRSLSVSAKANLLVTGVKFAVCDEEVCYGMRSPGSACLGQVRVLHWCAVDSLRVLGILLLLLHVVL